MIHRWKDAKRRRFTAKQIATAEDIAAHDILKMDLNAIRKVDRVLTRSALTASRAVNSARQAIATARKRKP